MMGMLTAVSEVLGIAEKARSLLSSLMPLATRFKGRLDLEKLTEDFFAGDIITGSRIHIRGVLFQYSCILPPVAYTRHIIGSTTEQLKSSPFDTNSGKIFNKIELSTITQTLSPPVIRFNDVDVIKNSARIAWLYPEHFHGLIFDDLPPTHDERQSAGELQSVINVRREQQPVLCLLPITGEYDSFYGSCVDMVGSVAAADPQIASLINESLVWRPANNLLNPGRIKLLFLRLRTRGLPLD
jgi:hypothetical protein